MMFFHRFYMYHPFQRHAPHVIGATCLYLAGKVEESPKKLRHLVAALFNVRNRREIEKGTKERMNADGNESLMSSKLRNSFAQIREALLEKEWLILDTITFDLSVDLPYARLRTMVKSIGDTPELFRVATEIVSHSLRSPLLVVYAPGTIAAAAMVLAIQFLGPKLADGSPAEAGKPGDEWFKTNKVSSAQTDDVMLCMLDLYSLSKNDKMTDQVRPEILEFMTKFFAIKMHERNASRGVKRAREANGERHDGRVAGSVSGARRNSQDDGPPRTDAGSSHSGQPHGPLRQRRASVDDGHGRRPGPPRPAGPHPDRRHGGDGRRHADGRHADARHAAPHHGAHGHGHHGMQASQQGPSHAPH